MNIYPELNLISVNIKNMGNPDAFAQSVTDHARKDKMLENG